MFTACFILLVNCLLCLVFNQMLKSQGKLQETTKPLFRWRIKIQRIHSKVQNLPELQRHILRQVEQTESLIIPCSAWQTAPYNNVVIKLTCAVIIRPYCPSSATAVLKTQVHSCVSFYCEFNDISVHIHIHLYWGSYCNSTMVWWFALLPQSKVLGQEHSSFSHTPRHVVPCSAIIILQLYT